MSVQQQQQKAAPFNDGKKFAFQSGYNPRDKGIAGGAPFSLPGLNSGGVVPGALPSASGSDTSTLTSVQSNSSMKSMIKSGTPKASLD